MDILSMLKSTSRTLIMGILNITPDSFSDGGKYASVEAAVRQAVQMVRDGADIIDIGGESTRPGAEKVSADEELSRVIPVIEAAAREVDAPLSIDTYKPEVAAQALEAGAAIMNDIWGFRGGRPEMARVAASAGCPVVLMHNREQPIYPDGLVPGVLEDLRESVRIAEEAGILRERIILDPGFGFGKTYEHNLLLMNHLDQIVRLGFPVLLGTSRKSMIYKTLQLPPDDVLEGTAATVALGVQQGCRIVRVHDVLAMKRAAAMTDAIVAAREHREGPVSENEYI